MYKEQYNYFEFEFEFVPTIGTIGFLIFIYFGTKMILCRTTNMFQLNLDM